MRSIVISYIQKLLKNLIPFIVVLLLWKSVSLIIRIARGVDFPSPWQTAVRLAALLGGSTLSEQTIYTHLSSSLQRWALGFGLAAVLGVAYGLLAGRIKTFELATARIPQMLLLVPGLAWIPAAILLFGIGESATIFMIAISAFAPIAINVLAGIKHVDIQLIRAAEMMGADRNTLFFRVLIPAALPALLSGLRIGLGTGWRVLVAAEMVVGTGAGLGYSLIQARWTLDYASSFACVVIICGIGLLCEHVLLKQIEKYTIERWALVEEHR